MATGRRLAIDNLRTGSSVVADSCNPVEAARAAWVDAAARAGASAVNIEVVCSDRAEHRRRVESRIGDIPGLVPPTWRNVIARDSRPWTRDRVIVDTAGSTIEQAFARLLSLLPDRRH